MIRIILALLFVVLFLIIGIPILGIEFLLGKINKQASDLRQLRMVQCAFKVVLFICGTKLTVIGEENVPKDEAVLYIPNHKSFFDIVITYARCPRLTGYISKNTVKKVPLLNMWMKRLHCLFIDRENIKEGLKTILTGIEKVKSGISICIFPEGTRNRNPEGVLPFKEGSFKIAEKSGCPIIPIAITNSSAIFEDHLPFIKRCHVIVEYGAPIRINELEPEARKKIGAHCQHIIEGMLEKNKELI